MPFIHLHTHSHYSLLTGLSKIDDLIRLAKGYRMPSLALTDHGNLYGAIEFYQKARAENIKPIIGVDCYMAERSRFERDPKPDNRTFHLTLLARDMEGYKNLIKLVTAGQLEGLYHGKPRIDKDILNEYRGGLVALSGGIYGEVARALWARDDKLAREVVKSYADIFGNDCFFLEVMHHPNLERHDEVKQAIISLSRSTGVPLVGTHASYYPNAADSEAHKTLIAIQPSSMADDTTRLFSGNDDFSFIGPEIAAAYFEDIPDAIKNTECVAEMCNLEITRKGWIFPDLKIAGARDYNERLRIYAFEGISERGLEATKEITDRLEYELKVIKDKGFAPYFLVVADLMYYARHHGIFTTIRGSCAGSLVTYLTKITNVNPLEYKLPFERFLNPERPSAPDIDMDFADNRRDEMLAYAKEKYGTDKVAQIGTFGTMMARGVVRDVARALGYPYGVGDRIAKIIPFGSQGFPMTIETAMKMTPELARAYEEDREVREVIDLAKKLEGCARHVSVHAAGVVITPEPLTEYVPLQREPNGDKIITQYDMHAVEEIGLLKFDFLGIKNLAILENAVRLVKEIKGEDVDIEKIPLDDKKTYALLAAGETMGLFQLGGSGMTRYLKDLKPNTIHDINAMVALYRPGPLELIPEYIRRKHNPKLVTYLDPRMREILEDSFGVITYQDDVMLIAIRLAGYSWGEADKFRKAMGKKIPAVMNEQKEAFITGCQKGGMSDADSNHLWLLIEPFAAYGFNKAHAACYGRVAYQTAYMKANFPVLYMTSLLSAESGNMEEVGRVIGECRRMGIPVLPPDINESYGDFTVIGNKTGSESIRFGLFSIKNLGAEISSAIIKEREEKGKFTDFTDFLDRVQHRNLNKKSLESLVRSGSMDCVGERAEMLANIDEALLYNRERFKNASDQSSLFGLIEDTDSIPKLKLKKTDPPSMLQKLAWEKELLGLYVSGHPLAIIGEKAKGTHDITGLKDESDGRPVTFIATVDDVRRVTTRRGERMAFVRMSDERDNIEVVVFPKTFTAVHQSVLPDRCVNVFGRLSMRGGSPSIIAENITLIESPKD